MPTFKHGRVTDLLFDQYDLTRFFKMVRTKGDVDLLDKTTFGSTAKEYQGGFEGGEVSCEGLFESQDPTIVGANEYLDGAIGASASPIITVGPAGLDVVNNIAKLCHADLTSKNVDATIQNLTMISAQFLASEGIRNGRVLAPQASYSTTGNGTAVNDAAGVGPIVSSVLNAGGSGYVVGDTGTINTGDTLATYEVLTVSSGAVATYSIKTKGTRYSIGANVATTVGGTQAGVGTGFTIDIVSVTSGLVANLHVLSKAGTTPTIDWSIEHSPDNSTWAAIMTFTQATDKTKERLTYTGAVNQYLRAVRTIGGTGGPAFECALAAARLYYL
jgi:hypothetical protein